MAHHTQCALVTALLMCVCVGLHAEAASAPHASSFVPRWTAPMPDASKPLAGYSLVANRSLTQVYHAVPEVGSSALATLVGVLGVGVGACVRVCARARTSHRRCCVGLHSGC